MAGGLRLNLGCGWDYRAGSLNVDSSSSSAADEVGDASDLRFGNSTVDRIEAMQLLEHFDLVHCRYVLAEWFRVLKESGELVLETPDLSASAERLSARKEDSEGVLRWIFGIDSPGLQHKTGFTKRILRELLEETGFSEVKFEKPTTYTKSPGLRVYCRKPAGARDAQKVALFRKRLKKALGESDSFVLVPLEKCVDIARNAMPNLGSTNLRREILARLAPYNPAVPIALLESADLRSLSEGSSVELDVLSWLLEKEFHRRAFALWVKSKKDPGHGKKAFDDFLGRMEQLVLKSLSSPALREETFDYVMTNEPREIGALHWWLVAEESQKSLSLAIKAHVSGDASAAIKGLEDSIGIFPDNYVAYWDLARVLIGSKGPESKADECYRIASMLATDRKMSGAIERERSNLRAGRMSDVPRDLICRTPTP